MDDCGRHARIMETGRTPVKGESEPGAIATGPLRDMHWLREASVKLPGVSMVLSYFGIGQVAACEFRGGLKHSLESDRSLPRGSDSHSWTFFTHPLAVFQTQTTLSTTDSKTYGVEISVLTHPETSL